MALKKIKDEQHEGDKMHVIISNLDGTFVLVLGKAEARAAELHLNRLPKTHERKQLGDVLYNFHAYHKSLVYDISSALYDDILPAIRAAQD